MIFKRGKIYWYEFRYNGERVRRSTKQRNAQVARDAEAVERARLNHGKLGLNVDKREEIPTLASFEQRFLNEIRIRRGREHPETVAFYESKYSCLLRFPAFAKAGLDRIDEKMISEFVGRMVADDYASSSINRALATLRRALRLALRWRIIDKVPPIDLLSGEHQREFVLTRKQQREYLEACPEFLQLFAEIAIETGMRRAELLHLRWADVHFEPVGQARLGYLRVDGTKSRYSKRNIPITGTAQGALLRARSLSRSEFVLVSPQDASKPANASGLNHAHQRVRELLGMPNEFVLHTFRHTFGTRLGEAGADAFQIQRLMGHSSVVLSQRYVHPSPTSMENVFLMVETQTAAALEKMENADRLPTNLPTASESGTERVQ